MSEAKVKPSVRIERIQTPIIPLVADLIRKHPDTVSLGQGVVYYGPPPQAVERIQDFLADPENHKYGPVEGVEPLHDVIVAKLESANGIVVMAPESIVVTAGANMGFYNAVLAISEPGDEIILPVPYFFNHEMAIGMTGCRVVTVPTDDNYQLRLDAIEAAITQRTRAIVTVSPNNPSGAVYSEASLRRVNDLCREHGIYHVSDEAYEDFVFANGPHCSPGSFPGADGYTISLFSLSKGYGFASWRIGYMVIPPQLFGAIKKIQDTILICPAMVSQYAAIGAFQAGHKYIEEKIVRIREVREIILDRLNGLGERVSTPRSDGAFYVLLKVNTPLEDMDIVERLVREFGVAVIPGGTFGIEDGCYLRIAYGSLTAETAAKGIDRLVKGLIEIVS